MSGFRKGFLNKPKNQENEVKNSIREKKDEQKLGEMSEQEFERISKLGVDRYLRKYIKTTRRAGLPIHYPTSRKYVASEMKEDKDFLIVVQEIYGNLTHDMLYGKIFNECALKIINEEKGVGIDKNKSEIKSQSDFERLCEQVVSESVTRAMKNKSVIDRETKIRIGVEMNGHDKIAVVRKELVKNEIYGFILENTISQTVWKIHEKESSMSKKEFETLCDRVTKECVDKATENLKLTANQQLDGVTILDAVMQILRAHTDGTRLLRASNINREYDIIQRETLKKHVGQIIGTLNLRLRDEVMSKEKFEKLIAEVLREMDRIAIANEKRLRNGEISLPEFDALVQEAFPRHESYPEISWAMKSNESYRKQFMTAVFNRAIQLSTKILEGVEIKEEFVPLCNRAYEKCRRKEEKEKDIEEKSKENGCEECSTKVEELTKYKKIVEDSLQKMKEVARNLKSEKENSKVLAENLESEKKKLENMNKEKATWKTCLANLKNEKEKCESLKKEKENLEKKLEKAEETMAENLKKEKENSEKLAEDLKIEKKNYEDSLKWFKTELEKSERQVENLQKKREKEKKEHAQMAIKMPEMEEFQRINNKETEEWKAQIMKMFEKQSEELKITKQELKKYQSKK